MCVCAILFHAFTAHSAAGPLAFVDYQRADYPSDDGYRFYFVFLRERLWVQDNGDDTEVITRVVRLCRVN